MKELRKHLDAAKDEYKSSRYPGDLAEEILSRPMLLHPVPSRNGRWVVGAIFAAAAALFVVLWLNLPSRVGPVEPQLADGSDEIEYSQQELEMLEQFAFADMPALSLPEIPEELEFAPVAPDFSAGVPEFSLSVPSFSLLGDEEVQQDSSKTEEPV